VIRARKTPVHFAITVFLKVFKEIQLQILKDILPFWQLMFFRLLALLNNMFAMLVVHTLFKEN